jgi:hypothetical protein
MILWPTVCFLIGGLRLLELVSFGVFFGLWGLPGTERTLSVPWRLLARSPV